MAHIGTVIGFEVRRALKKKSFWYTTLVPPLLVLAVTGIEFISNKNATMANQQQVQALSQNTRIGVFDETGLINKQALAKQHIANEASKAVGIAAVKTNSLDALFYYPKNVTKDGILIYAQDQGISNTPPYNVFAAQLLKQDVIARVSTTANNNQVALILARDPSVAVTTYKNGVETNSLANLIAPGAFLLAFLTLIVLLSYSMITSTTEEKENRAAEILLTAIKSRSLITGKILSIFVLAFVQITVLVLSLLAAYALFQSSISLPGGVSLSTIPIDPLAVTFGALFFVSGLVLYTGLLVGLSALFPSAQEAGRYLGIAMLWAFVPVYALRFITTSPNNFIVTVFTYFPLTAPTMALLRNTVGTLSVPQALGVLAITAASAVLAIIFAARAFRYGAMEYGRRISLKEILH